MVGLGGPIAFAAVACSIVTRASFSGRVRVKFTR